MNHWPLKVRFALTCAGLSTLAVIIAVLAVRPLVYRQQLRELDTTLATNAEELFRDIENFRGASSDFRKPVAARLIPAVLRGRYIQITGPEGQTLYQSANLRSTDLSGIPAGTHTLVIDGRNARIGTFAHGYLHVHLGTRLGTIEGVQEDILATVFWVGPLTALGVFGIGWFLGHRALQPVRQLAIAAEGIDAEHPEARLPLPPASDEIRRLTEVLNRSFDRLQNACAAATRFSADASHQLRTPLTVLRAGLDSLRTQPDTSLATRAELDTLLKQTRRLTTLTEDLLLLAKADAGRLELTVAALDLSTLTRAALDDTCALCEARQITAEADIPDDIAALGDPRRTAVILQNLTENAAKYAGENGRVRLTCTLTETTARIRIGNTGPGIPVENHASLFARFFRAGTAENIRGSGLGLNIARTLARAQGGDVTLLSSADNWTEFEFTLPAVSAERRS